MKIFSTDVPTLKPFTGLRFRNTITKIVFAIGHSLYDIREREGFKKCCVLIIVSKQNQPALKDLYYDVSSSIFTNDFSNGYRR